MQESKSSNATVSPKSAGRSLSRYQKRKLRRIPLPTPVNRERSDRETGQFRQLLLLRFSALLLFTAALSYGQTTTAPGTNDPLGRPQNYALFRDQLLVHFSPDRPGLSTSTNVFDGSLKPTSSEYAPGLNFVGPDDNIPILQAVAGRFYQPVSEDVFTIRRDPSDPNGWILDTEDGQNTISSTSLGANQFYGQVESIGWSDFFALASGDLDRAVSPQGLTQDELVVAWVDTSGQVDLGVLNFGLTGNFTPVFTQAVIPGAITTYNTNPTPVDNQISVAVGDFDGDGFNEIAVAAIVPPSNPSRGNSAVIQVSLFRYQSSGTSGSLTPIGQPTTVTDQFDNFAPITGTISLAAGDFDGSGYDQLMVGTALQMPDGSYNGSPIARVIPQIDFLKGGPIQVAASVQQSASGQLDTQFTYGQTGATSGYVPQSVTISGATGTWSAVNGVWPATSMPNDTFSIPLDSSQFGPFTGTATVTLGANLSQPKGAYTLLPPGPAGFVELSQNPAESMRVQIVPGLFRYDPANGFDVRRRQLAVTYNVTPQLGRDDLGDTVIDIIEVENDDSLKVPIHHTDVANAYALRHTFSLAAGAFKGVNDTSDPTWQLFLTGFGVRYGTAENILNETMFAAVWKPQPTTGSTTVQTLTDIEPVCMGVEQIGTTPVNPPLVFPTCSLWSTSQFTPPSGWQTGNQTPGWDEPASQHMRMPAVAADTPKTLLLGPPIHFQVENPVSTQTILEQPPQHTAFTDYNSSNGPTVQTISRFSTFYTGLKTSSTTSTAKSTKYNSNWNAGVSASFEATNTETIGLDAGDLGKFSESGTQELSLKASYDHEVESQNYNNSNNNFTVGISQLTGTDDLVASSDQFIDIWQYPIFGLTSAANPAAPYSYYEIVLPQYPSASTQSGGAMNADWYQPIHEVGNILSYPQYAGASSCNPPDLGSYFGSNDTAQANPQTSIWVSPCPGIGFGGSSQTFDYAATFAGTTGSTVTTDNKVEADLDVNLSWNVKAKIPLGTGYDTTFGFGLDAHGGYDWGTVTDSQTSTTASIQVEVATPNGSSANGYSFYPILYTSTAGTQKVTYVVGSTTGSFWNAVYGVAPDPALNLPGRFVQNYTTSGVLSAYVPDQTINRKKMKGFAVRSTKLDPVKNFYRLLDSPQFGTPAQLQARVYNYSLVTENDPITVTFSAIALDSSGNNEICAGGVSSLPAGSTIGGHVCPASSRTTIGQTTVNSLAARSNQIASITWAGVGKGFTAPAAGGLLNLRIYVDLSLPNGSTEIYPPERPCTALPCEGALNGIETIVDPGQNNEGWFNMTVSSDSTSAAAAAASLARTSLAAAVQASSASVSTANAEVTSMTLAVNDPTQTQMSSTTPITAYRGRRVSLKVTLFGSASDALSRYVSIYDGPDSNKNNLIASKVVPGLHTNGSPAFFDWTPTAVGIFTPVARLHGNSGIQASLLVNVVDLPGDVSGDGRIDTHDLNILQADLGKSVANSVCGAACDLNGDDVINQTDQILMTNLCTDNDCAFATPTYVGGSSTEVSDMQALRASQQAARSAWLAAHPDLASALANTTVQANPLGAYENQLAYKQELRSVTHYYKAAPVTTGPYAPQGTVANLQVSIYAGTPVRKEDGVTVPLTFINTGAATASRIEVDRVSVDHAKNGDDDDEHRRPVATIDKLVPGASSAVTIDLDVPHDIRQFKLIEEGLIYDANGRATKFTNSQDITIPCRSIDKGEDDGGCQH